MATVFEETTPADPMTMLVSRWLTENTTVKEHLACLQTLGGLLNLPLGTDLPTELPKAVQRLLAKLSSAS